MAKIVYPNSLKNWKFGKEAPQNFCSEQATIAERQGASENGNYEAKPTRPKANFSRCLGMSPMVGSKYRGQFRGWFFVFLAGALLFYCYAIREKKRVHAEMTAKLYELEKEKAEALEASADLMLQIQSQSDPAWVEMVLKRNLGMIREGQVKVYFHAE